MSEYLYGCDVLGAEGGDFADAVSATVQAEKPLSAERAHSLIATAIHALAEMNYYDQEEDTTAWRDDMAAQLAHMDEAVLQRGTTALPDKAADVLAYAVSAVAGMLDDGAQMYPDLSRVVDSLLQAIGVGVQVLGATRTTLGPRGRNVLGTNLDEILGELDDVVGVAVLEWDNHNSYAQGEVVYFNQRHWRALRDVTPPLLPAFMKGDEPGSSVAWGPISAADVYGGNVLGDDELDTILGMFDIQVAQRNMNALKPVTVGIARALVHGGQQVIALAQFVAKQKNLPDINTLATTAGHLQWHADKLAGLKDEKAVYASGDDAKKWTMQAFIESNAVEEGAAYLDEAWSKMWTEIEEKLKELPKEIVQTIAKLPGNIFEAVTGIPSWALYVGLAGATVLAGWGVYKLVNSSAGAAVAGTVTRHYLRGR